MSKIMHCVKLHFNHTCLARVNFINSISCNNSILLVVFSVFNFKCIIGMIAFANTKEVMIRKRNIQYNKYKRIKIRYTHNINKEYNTYIIHKHHKFRACTKKFKVSLKGYSSRIKLKCTWKKRIRKQHASVTVKRISLHTKLPGIFCQLLQEFP